MADAQVQMLRELLQSMVEAGDLSNDEREAVYDAVLEKARAVPRDAIVTKLDQAVGGSKKRRKEAIYILSQLADVPEAVERLGQALGDPDREVRSWAVQTVGGERLQQFAGALNTLMQEDPDSFVRQMAVHAAADMRSPANIKTLLDLAERADPEIAHAVLWAVTKYAHPESRRFLTRVFTHRKTDEQDRVIAAWGLAKLGDEKAYAYLVKALDDHDHEAGAWARLKHKVFGGPLVLVSHGQSRRAAQALCDIHAWPFEWSEEAVKETKQRLDQRASG